ncbi:hypothetical protein Tco_0154288 [Tanacetum coccineum]
MNFEVEVTEDEDEPVPTYDGEASPRRPVLKSKAKKNKEKEPPLEKQKRIRNAWTQDEELLLAECFIQVSEDRTNDTKTRTYERAKWWAIMWSQVDKPRFDFAKKKSSFGHRRGKGLGENSGAKPLPLNSGAKLHFADVASLLEFGTKSLAPRLPVL